VAALVLVAFGGALAQNTFCERYTGALFVSQGGGPGPAYSNATNQYALINLVVTCAFLGSGTAGTCGTNGAVTGLYNDNLNGRYFNGTAYPMTNYLAPTSSAALTTLVTHLDQFFSLALGCRAATIAYPYAGVANMNTVHSQMNINQATFNAFIGNVAASMISFGVPGFSTPAAPTDDLSYVVARMGPFWRYATAGNANSICTDATCQLATGFAEFDTTAAGVFSVLLGGTAGSTTVTINQGDAVHWNLGVTDGVTQTATAGGTTAVSGGIASGSGATIRSFTYTFATAGTFYFYNAGTTSSACSVVVTASGMTGTGMTMTGSSGMTGTGNGASAVAPSLVLAAGLAAVAAAIL